MYLGVDCGTQGTKVVILDPEQARIRGEGQAAHELISAANGRREQRVEWWTHAFRQAYRQALDRAGIDGRAIRAIGVSGQQHGMVLLDRTGAVIRPAKLWCDTESAAQNAQLVAQLGGEAGCLERLGLVPATGYTLSKLLWLKQHEPEAFGRIGTILLPHDYLNYWLTGECAAERGDASGTGYFDVRTRRWAPEVLALIAPDGRLERALPRLLRAEEPVATVRPALARELGLAEGVLVASGGGDNMMGAIGTGNIADGIVTLSLGTSGALYACTERPPVLSSPLVAPFCSSSNAWLPLICTMNLTGVVHQVRTLFGYDLERFQQEADRAGIGAGGITLLPFLNGERVPALPRASGSLLGLNTQNLTPANLCRAALEGTTFGLRHGLDLLRASGIRCDSIRLIGGGARSPLWRRLVAEILDTQVVCPRVGEAAALGAAIQAAWCEQHQRGTGVSLAELCGRFVALDPDSAVTPEAGAVARYRDAYQRYRRHLNQLHPDARRPQATRRD